MAWRLSVFCPCNCSHPSLDLAHVYTQHKHKTTAHSFVLSNLDRMFSRLRVNLSVSVLLADGTTRETSTFKPTLFGHLQLTLTPLPHRELTHSASNVPPKVDLIIFNWQWSLCIAETRNSPPASKLPQKDKQILTSNSAPRISKHTSVGPQPCSIWSMVGHRDLICYTSCCHGLMWTVMTGWTNKCHKLSQLPGQEHFPLTVTPCFASFSVRYFWTGL